MAFVKIKVGITLEHGHGIFALRETPTVDSVLVEVHPRTYGRWRRVIREFEKLQEDLHKLAETAAEQLLKTAPNEPQSSTQMSSLARARWPGLKTAPNEPQSSTTSRLISHTGTPPEDEPK